MMSIQPQWCELIANGQKTIEVRKTKPKLETPFKCYIYCTQGKGHNDTLWCSGVIGKMSDKSNGKVIGEFVCDEIEILRRNTVFNAIALYSQSRLTREEYFDYIGNKTAYIWHISDLVIYDKPRELSEFFVTDNSAVQSCKHREITGQPEYKTAHNGWIKGSYICNANGEPDWCIKCKVKPITRSPQSWCYVEESK